MTGLGLVIWAGLCAMCALCGAIGWWLRGLFERMK